MPKNYFDEPVAARYDMRNADMFRDDVIEPTVAFLADHARGGRALELGIGTGRIAVPLAARGVPVHGIELSSAMADRLRAKPGAEGIEVTIGDFATAKAGAGFDLAYLVFNTITNLTTQDEQVACFRNVADHLLPGGRFVIEVFVPALQRLAPGASTWVASRTPTHVCFDEYDIANQLLTSHHYWTVDDRVETASTPFRYVWAAELDLMAALAGMRLRERWDGWTRAPFTSDSTSHVSVWEKPASRSGQ